MNAATAEQDIRAILDRWGALVLVSSDPLDRIRPFKRRIGWPQDSRYAW